MKEYSLRKLLIKLLALFSVARGYNLAMLALAQYMASLFIFSNGKNHLEILFDKNLNFIILASLLSVAAGYIINNFYDLEKDAIQRPLRNYIERFVSQGFKLNTYLFLNALALLAALMVSWRVMLFFGCYQFLVWFYSHKVNRIVLINNLYSVMLTVFPFFALFLYYENYSPIIFFHAGFLFLLLLCMDIVKDLTTSTADVIYNYRTLPVVYGEKKTKQVLLPLMLITAALSVFMWDNSATGYMRYFFLFTSILLVLMMIPVWTGRSKTAFKVIYLIFKLLIGFGIFNMIFIDLNPLDLQNII